MSEHLCIHRFSIYQDCTKSTNENRVEQGTAISMVIRMHMIFYDDEV